MEKRKISICLTACFSGSLNDLQKSKCSVRVINYPETGFSFSPLLLPSFPFPPSHQHTPRKGPSYVSEMDAKSKVPSIGSSLEQVLSKRLLSLTRAWQIWVRFVTTRSEHLTKERLPHDAFFCLEVDVHDSTAHWSEK